MLLPGDARRRVPGRDRATFSARRAAFSATNSSYEGSRASDTPRSCRYRSTRTSLARWRTYSVTFGLAITTGLLAWQSRAAAEQAKIGNARAGAVILSNAATGARGILTVIIDRPELYGYFYDSKPCPASMSIHYGTSLASLLLMPQQAAVPHCGRCRPPSRSAPASARPGKSFSTRSAVPKARAYAVNSLERVKIPPGIGMSQAE